MIGKLVDFLNTWIKQQNNKRNKKEKVVTVPPFKTRIYSYLIDAFIMILTEYSVFALKETVNKWRGRGAFKQQLSNWNNWNNSNWIGLKLKCILWQVASVQNSCLSSSQLKCRKTKQNSSVISDSWSNQKEYLFPQISFFSRKTYESVHFIPFI